MMTRPLSPESTQALWIFTSLPEPELKPGQADLTAEQKLSRLTDRTNIARTPVGQAMAPDNADRWGLKRGEANLMPLNPCDYSVDDITEHLAQHMGGVMLAPWARQLQLSALNNSSRPKAFSRDKGNDVSFADLLAALAHGNSEQSLDAENVDPMGFDEFSIISSSMDNTRLRSLTRSDPSQAWRLSAEDSRALEQAPSWKGKRPVVAPVQNPGIATQQRLRPDQEPSPQYQIPAEPRNLRTPLNSHYVDWLIADVKKMLEERKQANGRQDTLNKILNSVFNDVRKKYPELKYHQAYHLVHSKHRIQSIPSDQAPGLKTQYAAGTSIDDLAKETGFSPGLIRKLVARKKIDTAAWRRGRYAKKTGEEGSAADYVNLRFREQAEKDLGVSKMTSTDARKHIETRNLRKKLGDPKLEYADVLKHEAAQRKKRESELSAIKGTVAK